MSGMDRSLVFTALLHLVPDFGPMESRRGSRLVTDAVERLRLDREADPTVSITESVVHYVADVTNGGSTDPGVWERYVDALLAGDEARAQRAGVRGLPPGIHVS